VTANTQSGNAYPGQCRQCDPFPFNQVVDCTGGTTSTVRVSFRYVRSAVCDQSSMCYEVIIRSFVGFTPDARGLVVSPGQAGKEKETILLKK